MLTKWVNLYKGEMWRAVLPTSNWLQTGCSHRDCQMISVPQSTVREMLLGTKTHELDFEEGCEVKTIWLWGQSL